MLMVERKGDPPTFPHRRSRSAEPPAAFAGATLHLPVAPTRAVPDLQDAPEHGGISRGGERSAAFSGLWTGGRTGGMGVRVGGLQALKLDSAQRTVKADTRNVESLDRKIGRWGGARRDAAGDGPTAIGA
jgi:hypothetical protein